MVPVIDNSSIESRLPASGRPIKDDESGAIGELCAAIIISGLAFGAILGCLKLYRWARDRIPKDYHLFKRGDVRDSAQHELNDNSDDVIDYPADSDFGRVFPKRPYD